MKGGWTLHIDIRKRKMLVIILAIKFFATGVSAQTTDAVCPRNDTTAWLFNGAGESPCTVWSKLQSLCLPADRYVNVPALETSGWTYDPPADLGGAGSLCQCNVVAYALMAGCSWCQLGDGGGWVTEERWRRDCPAYNSTSLPLAQTVLPIPAFAFRPWSNSRWTPDLARLAATSPSAIGAPVTGTTTLFRSFPPSTPAPLASSSQPGPSSSAPAVTSDAVSSSGSGVFGGTQNDGTAAKWGVVVGGIAGGVFLLVLIILLVIYWRRKHRFDKARLDNSTECDENKRRAEELFMREPANPYKTARRSVPSSSRPRTLFGLGSKSKSDSGGVEGGGSDVNRISTWTTTIFQHPRKAPAPHKLKKSRNDAVSGYTTTTQRLREKPVSVSSASTGCSTIDAVLVTGPGGEPLPGAARADRRMTFGAQSTLLSPAPPSTAASARFPFPAPPNALPLRQDRSSPPSPSRIMSASSPPIRKVSIKSSLRKPVPIRDSYDDFRSDLSSIQSRSASPSSASGHETRPSLGTLPSFSTSVKEIKEHRTRLAERIAAGDVEAGGEGRPEVVGGHRGGGKKGKSSKKSKNSDKLTTKTKKKTTKVSGNTHRISTAAPDRRLSAVTRASTLYAPYYTSIQADPAELPEMVHQPLPRPPSDQIGRAAYRPTIDFSVALPSATSSTFRLPSARSRPPSVSVNLGQISGGAAGRESRRAAGHRGSRF